MTWRASILTLFPEMFPGPLGYSLAGKALENRIWSLQTIQIRDQMLCPVGDPVLTGLLELVGVLRIHAARNFKQHSFFEFRWFNIHISGLGPRLRFQLTEGRA